MIRLSDWTKRRTILMLRWLLIIVTSYIIIFGRGPSGLQVPETLFIVAFLLSNVALSLLPEHLFSDRRFDHLLVVSDTLFVSLGITLSGRTQTDFYLLYFLVIMLTTVGQDLRNILATSGIICAVYGIVVLRLDGFDLPTDPTLLLRVPFLFIVSIFYGYLVDIARRERGMRGELEIEKRDLESLLEITRAISSTLETRKVLEIIVQEVEKVIQVDRCSVVFVPGEDEGTGYVMASHDNPEIRNLKIEMANYPELRMALQRREVVVVEDIFRDPLVHEVTGRLQATRFRSLMVLPMVYGDDVLGTLFLRVARAQGEFTERERKFCQIVANASANALKNAQLFEELRQQAITDGLTGMYNHRHFQDRFKMELERTRRSGRPLSVLMIDIDNFKWINDYYGHAVGDEAIRYIAVKLRANSRTTDVVARYGGDEFVWLLAETDLELAQKVADRFVLSVARDPFPATGGLSVSIGIATYPQNTKNLSRLLHLADKAMYRAKSEGGDRARTITEEEARNVIDWGEPL